MTHDNVAAAPAILRIDRAALAANYRQFCAMTKAEVAGILKAQAYGIGGREMFDVLYKEGCRTFFVATPDEGLEIAQRKKTDVRIYILGGVYAGAEDVYIENALSPILNSEEDIAKWSAASRNHGRKLPAALHIDTGMNRLGTSMQTTAAQLKDIDLSLVMSHFASSEDAASAMNERQMNAFAHAIEAFPGIPKSLCNSSGLFRFPQAHYDLVRPGYALYGGNPLPGQTNPVKPVISLHVRVLQVRRVKKGESAGYNATHVFDKDTICATVAIGYADGFPRGGSNAAKLYWQGQSCPIRGRVSMDLVIVEIGHLPQPPHEGDWMEVLGENQSVDQLADDCGTIGYNILTALGPRYHRVYTS